MCEKEVKQQVRQKLRTKMVGGARKLEVKIFASIKQKRGKKP